MPRLNKFGVLVLMISPLLIHIPSAFAKGPGGGGPPGFAKGEKKGWDEGDVPPGWGKGQKKGWEEAVLPPGLQEDQGENQGEDQGEEQGEDPTGDTDAEEQ